MVYPVKSIDPERHCFAACLSSILCDLGTPMGQLEIIQHFPEAFQVGDEQREGVPQRQFLERIVQDLSISRSLKEIKTDGDADQHWQILPELSPLLEKGDFILFMTRNAPDGSHGAAHAMRVAGVSGHQVDVMDPSFGEIRDYPKSEFVISFPEILYLKRIR